MLWLKQMSMRDNVVDDYYHSVWVCRYHYKSVYLLFLIGHILNHLLLCGIISLPVLLSILADHVTLGQSDHANPVTWLYLKCLDCAPKRAISFYITCITMVITFSQPHEHVVIKCLYYTWWWICVYKAQGQGQGCLIMHTVAKCVMNITWLVHETIKLPQ